MKNISRFFDKLRFPDWSIPFALLAVCILAYGLLIPKLGFYQDDWHFIYNAYTRGAAGLTELLNFDGHPLAAPLYIASFNLLGFNPINWQIFSLFWRWLAVVIFWLVLHRTWPAQRRATFTAAAIYIIYPLYTMQPMTVVYFEVWISHFLLALSFLLSIEAIKQPRRFWLFTILAILLKILHTFSSEYTWGMEFARPILIWLAMPAVESENIRHRLRKTIQIYSPYLAILLLALIWRGFFYNSPVLSRSNPLLLDAILADPVSGIKQLVLNSIPDMILVLFSTWSQTINPGFFSMAERFNLQLVGLMAASTIGIFAFLHKLDITTGETQYQGTTSWRQEAFIFGAAALIFGMIPVYAAGYFVFLKLEPWNGRFVLGSMPGVAILTTLFIEMLIDTPRKRLFSAALIISLGIGWQVRMTNNFRWAWNAETNFYRQMILRAPGLSPHTAIISNQEFLGLMGDYPTAFALNTIYATPGDQKSGNAKTWLFLIDSNFGGQTETLVNGTLLEETKHSTHFSGKSSDSLVIYYEPDLGQCLWVITPENATIPIVPNTLQQVRSLTNSSLIQSDAAPPPFLQTILAKEPDDWCSFYQRGSLAHQTLAWDKTVEQWEQATKQKLHPTNGFEYLPFIEAYARLGKWNQAMELTKEANKLSKGMEAIMCESWVRFEQQTSPTAEREQALVAFRALLDCK